MRKVPIRSCEDFVNKRNFNSYHSKLILIQAYGDWIMQMLIPGWDAYLFTFTFNHIPGSSKTKMDKMMKEMEHWYGRLATRSVRNPKSPSWIPLLPVAVLCPDYPVPKYSKRSIREVSVNEGLHYHGIVLATPFSRISKSLVTHFNEKQRQYLTSSLIHIDVQPITNALRFTTDYGMKGIKRWELSWDHLLIRPKNVSELPSKSRPLTPEEKALKDIQSAHNLSDEVARHMVQEMQR